MVRRIWIIGLIAVVAVVATGCEDPAGEESGDEAVDQQVDDQADEQRRAGQNEADEAGEEVPVQETDVEDDDRIGELPEGVGIEVGESVPEVGANSAEGEEVELFDLADDEHLLVFFYRGGWCPYCNFQVREMTEANQEFSDRGVLPVAVSVDQPDRAADTDEAYDIPFPVLADPDLRVHEAFGVTYEADDEEVEQLAEHGMDIEEASGRDHNSYAIPSVFLIDREGTVRWAHANRDYQVRPSVQQLLGVVDEQLD